MDELKLDGNAVAGPSCGSLRARDDDGGGNLFLGAARRSLSAPFTSFAAPASFFAAGTRQQRGSPSSWRARHWTWISFPGIRSLELTR